MSFINIFPQYAKACWLESALGSPKDVNNLFSFEKSLALDEASQFPALQADFLTDLELQKYYVPSFLGGKLRSFEEFTHLFKSIYRRDATLGLGYGATTFMGSIQAFIAGSISLKKRVADIILNGATISVAYHEKDHGNDLLGNTANAIIQENDSYTITGTKWVVNNVSTSNGLTVFVKTSNNNSSRSFSLFFIDKEHINQSSLQYLPKINTLGVKGCRISGVKFNNTEITKKALIGNVGDGVEISMKAFQITRATLPGMSIGAGDTALRCVYEFAKKRNLYGKSIINIPHVSEIIIESYIQLLICDCLSITATRSLHFIPEQMSIISAIAKFYIPKEIRKSLKQLAVVLGARHYIREGEHSIFQKILRDYPVVCIGHSSDTICLNTILPQLKQLLQKNKTTSSCETNLLNIFSLNKTVPEFTSDRLKLSNNGYNDIINLFLLIDKTINENIEAYKADENVVNYVMKAKKMIHDHLNVLKVKIENIQTNIHSFSKKTYELTELYCKIFVAISCIWLWIYNYSKISSYFDSGVWLILALNLLFNEKLGLKKTDYDKYINKSLAHLDYLFSHQLSFSIVPIYYY